MHVINLWWPARGDWRLIRHIATTAAAGYHFKSPSRPPLTSLELNLGDGKRAHSREKSVPHDFLLLCSFSSAVTPLPTSLTTQMCTVLPFPPTDVPPSHNYSHPLPLKPKDPAIAQLLKLSQEPVSLHLPTHHSPFSCFPLPPCAPSPSAFQHDKPHGISLVL